MLMRSLVGQVKIQPLNYTIQYYACTFTIRRLVGELRVF